MNFERAVQRVLVEEGVFNNRVSDRGGATNFGISLAFYRNVIDPAATEDTIRHLTIDEATAIYRKYFWNVNRCDEMPYGVALLVFDCAVNQGAGTAARLLQLALRLLGDGVIGPVTLKAVNASNFDELADEYCARRCVRYMENPQFGEYGLGWMRRLFRMHQNAVESTEG